MVYIFVSVITHSSILSHRLKLKGWEKRYTMQTLTKRDGVFTLLDKADYKARSINRDKVAHFITIAGAGSIGMHSHQSKLYYLMISFQHV